MCLEILNKINEIQNKEVSVLYLAYQNDLQIVKYLQNYRANFDVLCPSLFSRGFLSSRISKTDNVNFLLQQQLKEKHYDVVITSSLLYSDLGLFFKKYNFKYVINLNQENLIPAGYQKFSQNSFKLIQVKQQETKQKENKQLTQQQIDRIQQSNELFKEFVEQYEIKPIKYGKYGINYLYDVVPGKVSIIMIVSERNNDFAQLIRQLKLQNVQSTEYIIIDNAAGFRNNVKPDIRYGNKMPLDFCQYHAKQISTGEYIIVLNQNSKLFKINEYIAKGKYQTR